MVQIQVKERKLLLQVGDITKHKGEAIVNAANPYLAGGGGVDGAIHKAGGSYILKECKQIISEIGRLSGGKAVITSGGHMPCQNVIHTVGPVYKIDPKKAPDILRSAYMESLKLADKMALKDIAFPSIATGVYGYPVEEAADIAMQAVLDFLEQDSLIEEVYFYLFTSEDYEVYKAALEAMLELRAQKKSDDG